MVHEREELSARVLGIATRYLARWADPLTRSSADDLAQEVACEVVYSPRRPSRDRLGSFVRTVSRRRRGRAIQRQAREEALIDAQAHVAEQRGPAMIAIGDHWIAREECLAALDAALAEVGAFNERLLLDYYHGFSCGELADRYGLSVSCIKVRLHRSRRRIHAALLSRLRVGG